MAAPTAEPRLTASLRFGTKGLYTSTLFTYKETFFEHMRDAVNLASSSGRSITNCIPRFCYSGKGSRVSSDAPRSIGSSSGP